MGWDLIKEKIAKIDTKGSKHKIELQNLLGELINKKEFNAFVVIANEFEI